MLVSELSDDKIFSPAELDKLWDEGWFRSGNLMGRTKVIQLDKTLYTTTPTRLHLADYKPSKSLRRLLARSKNLRLEVSDLKITARVEALYRSFAKRFNIPFHSFNWYLTNGSRGDYFLSKQVSLYDGERLVASSVFDCGENSISSIVGLYREDYKKYSPGILTMLMEVLWAKENGFCYYYPGYILMEDPKMDYKLRIGDFEFLNDERKWVPDFMGAMRQSFVKDWVTKSNLLSAKMNTYRINHFVDLANEIPFSVYGKNAYSGYPINHIFTNSNYEKKNIALIAAYHPESKSYHLRFSCIYQDYDWYLNYLHRFGLMNVHSREDFNKSLTVNEVKTFEHPSELCEAIIKITNPLTESKQMMNLQ